jgi:hypothetical protein
MPSSRYSAGLYTWLAVSDLYVRVLCDKLLKKVQVTAKVTVVEKIPLKLAQKHHMEKHCLA